VTTAKPNAIWGVLLAAVGAAAGYGVHLLLPGLPWLTASLILGVLVGSIPQLRPNLDGILEPGLVVAARRLLRLGIVVLGLQLSLDDIAALGWLAIVLIVALVAVSFVITWLIGRLFRLEGDQAVLMAAGFSICGVSAVGAMAAARGSNDKDTGTPITLVTLYGTLAIVVLPFLSGLLGLTTQQFGHWVGASVHDVGQVVATAQTAGAAALAVAIVVKLTRVLMLAPMVAIASVQTRRKASADAESQTKFPSIVPLFIVGFIAAVLIRSFVPLPADVVSFANVLQSALLAAALFGIGASLRLEQLVRTGARALAVGLVSWIVILALALVVVYVS
jgi:uncharacterized integral membrane protein (TIGR00698 family)